MDEYDTAHTASLLEFLAIDKETVIPSATTSGEKATAGKKKQTPLDLDDSALKSAREICKVAPELLEDIMGMSDGCPLTLWKAINNRYGINDVALQTARRDLGQPDVYLVRAGDTVRSIWARIQALTAVLATETGGHKISERSRLVILATALKSIDPAFEGQFNALTDDTPADAVLKALDRVESSISSGSASTPGAILYAGQYQQHLPRGRGAGTPNSHRLPASQQPTGQHARPRRRGGWSTDKYCTFHGMHGHSLDECREAARQRVPPSPSTQASTLAAMTAAAVAAASALPPRATQATIFAAMTAAAAAARPSDFAITSESSVADAALAGETFNKPFSAYSAFSLVQAVHLPTIADTGATQHTTNRRDLLHDFVPLSVPSRLVCADGAQIECVGHGTMHGTTTVDGEPSAISIRGVAYVPGASHTLISPQQLLDAGCRVEFDQQHGFQFFLDNQLRLFTYRSGNLYYLPVAFTPAPVAVGPAAAALSVYSPSLCMDLVHRRLGHAGETRCREFVKQSTDFTVQEKRRILSSSLSPHCAVCLLGKQAARGVHRQEHTVSAARAQQPGELISLDLVGPMRQKSIGGHRYLLTVTDSFSRMHFVRALPNKSSAIICTALRSIVASFPASIRIRRVRLDNARELDADVAAWILSVGAKREPTPPYTSPFNGVVERFNREVMTRVRCLLFDAQLPSEWWAEAARHACDVINMTPTRSNPRHASPFTLWHGFPPPSRHLRVFGAPGMLQLHAHQRHKTSPQSTPVRFISTVDYSTSTYRVYVIDQRRVVDTRNVIFDERSASRPPPAAGSDGLSYVYVPLLVDDDEQHEGRDVADPYTATPGSSSAAPAHGAAHNGVDLQASGEAPIHVSVGVALEADELAKVTATRRPEPELDQSAPQIIGDSRGSVIVSSKQIDRAAAISASRGGEVVATTRSGRNVRQPSRLGDAPPPRGTPGFSLPKDSAQMLAEPLPPSHQLHTMLHLRQMNHALKLAQNVLVVPRNLREVLACDEHERDKWFEAMRSEYRALTINDTFDLVELPAGRKAVGTRWVFKVKAPDLPYKARFVGRGFSQKQGIDYDDTYAPVLRLENLRLLLAHAVASGHVAHSMDINNAFLQAKLHEEVYVTQPEGFVDPDRPHHVLRLKRALYGLKQAPLAWNRTLNSFLVEIGFTATHADPCLYTLHDHGAQSDDDRADYDPELHQVFVCSVNKPSVILSVYVDDLLIVGALGDVEAVKLKLRNRFHIKDFGPVSTILGIDVVYNNDAGTLDISQSQKILDLAREFQLDGAKPLLCPLPAGTDLRVVEHTSSAHTGLKFRRLVGALLYIALATRPDVLHAVIYLSRFVRAFDNTHFEAARHVLRYLHGTRHQTIRYSRDDHQERKIGGNIPLIHCDASYGTDPLTMKSYSGNITVWAGGPIAWWARLQKTVALSTAEAELVAVTDAARQALYLRRLLPALGFSLDRPIRILNDNQSTIAIVHKPVYAWPKRLKHVTIKHAFVYDHIKRGDISVSYIPTNENLADFLTKHIAGPKLKLDKLALDLVCRS